MDYYQRGLAARFRLLQPLVVEAESVDAARAASLGLQLELTGNAVRVALSRLGRAFGSALRDEVALTVTGEMKQKAELAHLRHVLETT